MNYNIFVNPDIDYVEPINNRARVNTGTHCNYKCGFCYYKDKLNEVTGYEIIKKRIDYLVECGITEVDLSGGESSIHQDWFKILDYCKEQGLKISTLSNGSKFKDINFLKKSREHGLQEILFSLHGYDQESHNKIVNHPLGFQHILQAIKNANDLDILVRINCTVNNDNYKHLDKFVELINQFNIFEINFLPLNYWEDANDLEKIDYNIITPHICKAIDKLKNKCIINVRYVPYCFMIGYEKYVCNVYQHIYDLYDWNIALYDQRTNKEDYNNKYLALYAQAKNTINNTYYKQKECFDCKFFHICDGVEHQLIGIDIHPQSGEKIKEVNYFRKGYYEINHINSDS